MTIDRRRLSRLSADAAARLKNVAARAGRPTSEEVDTSAKVNKPGRADYLAVKAALQERLLDEIGERGLLEHDGADVAAAVQDFAARAIASEDVATQRGGACPACRGAHRRDDWYGPAGAAARRSGRQRHPGQRTRQGVCRAVRQARTDRRALPRRRTYRSRHRAHRRARGPAHRHGVADGRPPAAGRQPRERDASARHDRRSHDLDTPFRPAAAAARRPAGVWARSRRRSSNFS